MFFHRLANVSTLGASWLNSQVPITQERVRNADRYMSWDDIKPYAHFEWQPCFGDFQCARLQVPMDWQGTSTDADRTVEIAVIKVEATVPVTDSTYGGAVVLNPGGPGGSGVDQVLKGGRNVRTILSAGPGTSNIDAKHFDIIGFDPRGVNNTRPSLACYRNYLEAAAAAIEDSAHGMMDTSNVAFDIMWASKRAVAEGCSKKAAEEGIGKHMSTAPVARDIIEIFERHGEWREKKARQLLNTDLRSLTAGEKQSILERTAWRKDAEMVQYWGFSYGTILGATLSAMFPERIRRAVLDGVADSFDYMAGGWATNLKDTDMTFVKLAEHCFEGGKENCAMWHEDGPAVIIDNMQRTITTLKSSPIPVLGTAGSSPMVVTYNDLKLVFRDIVYWPIRDFPQTAQILHDLSQNNGSSLAAYKRNLRPSLGVPLSEKCLRDGPYSPSCFPYGKGAEGGTGILCSDAPGERLNQNKSQFREYADKIMAQSFLLGAYWAEIHLSCTAWHARPHWRYEGAFESKTAHPVLFAGNTIDPVTPLSNAFLMAKGFEGAGVLHQDSEGHCTYSGISMCSMKAIRKYFQSGDLPGKKGGLEDLDEWKGFGGLCETSRVPFDGHDVYSGKVPELPDREIDQALWEALLGLNRVWP